MGGNSSGAEGVSSLVSSAENNHSGKVSNKHVLVVFSSVDLKTLRECGQEKTTLAEDGLTCFVEKKINIVEWECSPRKGVSGNIMTHPPTYDKIICIDCSEASGKDLYNTCNGKTKEVEAYSQNTESSDTYVQTQDENIPKSRLVDEIVFATRQFKEFLYSLEKNGMDSIGKVKLYISAIHPVESLLFAFERVLGFSVPDENLYQSFWNIAKNNSFLSTTQQWLTSRGWNEKLELEYCGVNQIFIMEAKVLTPKGKYKKWRYDMDTKYTILRKATDDIMHSFTYDYLTYHDKKPYEDKLAKWKGRGGLTNDGPGNNRYGGQYNMTYPAINIDGVNFTAPMLRDILDADWDAKEQERREASKLSALKKQKEKLIAQADEIEDQATKEAETRTAVIMEKQKELSARNVNGTKERKIWEENFNQVHDKSDTYSYEIQLIEFEGNQLDHYQLGKESQKISIDYDEKIKEAEKLRKAAENLDNVIEKIELEKNLTIAQLIVGGVFLVGSVIVTVATAGAASPMVGIAISCLGGAIDAGLEIAKWAKVDDSIGEHWVSHSLTIGLDIVFCAFGPLFRIIAGKIGAPITKEIAAAEKLTKSIDNVGEIEKTIAQSAHPAPFHQVEQATKQVEQATKEFEKAQTESSKYLMEFKNANQNDKLKLFLEYNNALAHSEETKAVLTKANTNAATYTLTRFLDPKMVEQLQKAQLEVAQVQQAAQKAGYKWTTYEQASNRIRELDQYNKYVNNYLSPLKNPNITFKERSKLGVQQFFGFLDIKNVEKIFNSYESLRPKDWSIVKGSYYLANTAQKSNSIIQNGMYFWNED